MKKRLLFLTCLALLVGLLSCGDDEPSGPEFPFGPAGRLVVVAGTNVVTLSWQGSSFAGSPDFVGYVVYDSPVPLATSSNPDSLAMFETRVLGATSAAVAATPRVARYYHVRVRGRNPDRLSAGTNEIVAAARPESDNTADDNSLFDFAANTTTMSAWGWDRLTGTGRSFAATTGNAFQIDLMLREKPNSNSESELVSPTVAMGGGDWRNTLFADLGSGEAAWQTADAPADDRFSTAVTVALDHTYAVKTWNGHHAKVRVTALDLNVEVPVQGGGTVLLNRAKVRTAFQLLENFPHY